MSFLHFLPHCSLKNETKAANDNWSSLAFYDSHTMPLHYFLHELECRTHTFWLRSDKFSHWKLSRVCATINKLQTSRCSSGERDKNFQLLEKFNFRVFLWLWLIESFDRPQYDDDVYDLWNAIKRQKIFMGNFFFAHVVDEALEKVWCIKSAKKLRRTLIMHWKSF
jgi:hypothetical protein